MSEERPGRRTTFGLALYTGQQFEPRGRWYHDAVPLAEAAEAAGFDAFWVSEHHGFVDGYLPAPLSLLASVAARTDRLLLGTGVVLGPLRHPVRLAEEAAVVDQLSGGRLILGLGLGYADDELRALELSGPGRGARLEELIHILRAAWTGEQFSFDGATAQLDRVRVTPTPFAGRQIPILLGGYAPAARRRAARLGDGHIVGRGAPDIVRAAIDVIAAEGGPERSPFTFVVNIVAILDEDGGHPVEALRAFETQQLTYESIQRSLDVYDGQVPDPADPPGQDALTLGRIETYVQIRGGADDLAENLDRIIESLPSWAEPHIALRIVFPEPDLEHQLERIAAFGERVLPRVRRS